MTEEEEGKRTEEMKIAEAYRTHESLQEALKGLFPKISEDYKLSDQDIRHLLARIFSVSKKIRGIRHYFNHKYEESVVERYKGSMKDFSLENIEGITNEIFKIASNLGLIYKRSSYAPSDFSYSSEISDQIDLILFGGIKAAIYRFYEVADKDDFYWQAREKYFASENLSQIVAN